MTDKSGGIKNTNNRKDDPRFKIAHREALIGIGLAIINFIWWYGFAYGLGSKPVEEYTYVFGLPAWFFYSSIVGPVVIFSILVFLVKGYFREVPFDEDDKGDELV